MKLLKEKLEKIFYLMTKNSAIKFEIIGALGKGSFSSVYLVKNWDNGKTYAMKKIKIEKLNKDEIKNSFNEIRILASIKHPNVVNYKEAFIDET